MQYLPHLISTREKMLDGMSTLLKIDERIFGSVMAEFFQIKAQNFQRISLTNFSCFEPKLSLAELLITRSLRVPVEWLPCGHAVGIVWSLRIWRHSWSLQKIILLCKIRLNNAFKTWMLLGNDLELVACVEEQNLVGIVQQLVEAEYLNLGAG